MNLTKLTHWQPNIELWVDLSEVIFIERKTPARVTTELIVPGQDEPSTTQLALKNGRVVSCLETPEQIIKLSKK